MMSDKRDLIVVGGGLAGLTASVIVARQGKKVTLIEKSQHTGGRAITEYRDAFRINLGPHAVYLGGAAARIYRRLGVHLQGAKPGGPAFGILDGKLHPLPRGLASTLFSPLLHSASARIEFVKQFARIAKIKTAALQDLTLENWLADEIRHPEVRMLLRTFFRVACYSADSELLSAGSAIDQLQIALAQSVLYLDGGWQTLVHQLTAMAKSSGVEIISTSVESVKYNNGNCSGGRPSLAASTRNSVVEGVLVSGDRFLSAGAVILAVSPTEVARLVKHSGVRQWVDRLSPVKAACLTVGLKRLPHPEKKVVFGLDTPLYYSVHSAFADLADTPEQALIHTAKYLRSGDDVDVRSVRKELDALLDLVQPGWRSELVVERFMPQLTVSYALPEAALGGTAGRPALEVAGISGLFLAGDWVGSEGLLADAAVASAEKAAEAALRFTDQRDLKIA